MKKLKIIITSAILSMSLATASLAGIWQPQTTVQWRYQNDDGSYATGWVLDGGKYYYLDASGIMLADTRTPDGYYVDASGVWDGQASSTAVITAGESTPALSYTTSTPATVYQPGIYQVGVNIPAGEYVLLAQPERTDVDYEIRTNDNFDYYNYDGFVDGTEFRYNVIALLKDGQYLRLNGCTASPVSEVSRLDSSQAEMYKVGYHIPAGTYHLYSLGYNNAGYAILSSPTTTNSDDVIDIDILYSDTSVTVASGQYLYLYECILAEETDSAAAEASRSHKEDTAAVQPAQPASKVVTAGVTERLSTTTSTPLTVYPYEYYEVGVNIPAGEYVLLATSDYQRSYYEIRSNADFESYDDMIDFCSFNYNAIIRLEEGQFLRLLYCSASPIEEMPQISFLKGEMFKVGYHIPAGTYRISMNEGSYSGTCYILSAPTDNYDVVLSFVSAYDGEDADITVQDGQYIQLKGCHMAQ